ncbi:MAG: sialidase family protein [Gallionella sp.]
MMSSGDQKNARRLLLALVVVAFGAAFYRVVHHPAPALFQMPADMNTAVTQQVGRDKPEFRTDFVSTQQNISTHAASLVELGDGRIRAFWFAGSREGAPDVVIRTAVFDPAKHSWSPERSIVNREDTQRALLRYVKKIGNPVPQRAPDGKLWLYYVTVSLGGWAGSSITAITSTNDGATWSKPRRLITSPFMNISTLIKGTPFLYRDGTMGLPEYHEFIGKFGELLRIDGSGEIITKQRLSSGKSTLQPVMLIQSPRQALVLMRRSGTSPKRVISTSTDDAGQHWSKPVPTPLANPDAALSGVVLPDGKILVVLNNIEEGRDALSLVVSADGGANWKKVYQLEDQGGRPTDPAHFGEIAAELARATDTGITDASAYAKSAERNKCVGQHCEYEFSYPYLIETRNGNFDLVYTWNRSFIKHVRFNRAWLDQQIEERQMERPQGEKANDAQLH